MCRMESPLESIQDDLDKIRANTEWMADRLR